jgi:hypothetical protein
MIAPVTASERDLGTLSGIVSGDCAVVTHEGSAALCRAAGDIQPCPGHSQGSKPVSKQGVRSAIKRI